MGRGVRWDREWEWEQDWDWDGSGDGNEMGMGMGGELRLGLGLELEWHWDGSGVGLGMGIGMGKGKGVGMGSRLGLGMGMATGPLMLPQPPAEPPVSAGCSLSLLTDPSFLTAPHTRSPPLYFLTNPQSLTDSMFPNSSPFLVGMGNVGMGRAKIVAVGWNEDKKLLTGGCGRGFGIKSHPWGLDTKPYL